MLNIELILKILGGVAAVGSALAWLNHYFASGEARLSDRRKDKDAQNSRIENLEKQLSQSQKDAAYQIEVKHAALSQLNRLSWAYDSLRSRLIVICKTLSQGEAVPSVLLIDCQGIPDAGEILKDANEVISGLHVAFAESEENHS